VLRDLRSSEASKARLQLARSQNDGFDPCTAEIERWGRLSPDSYPEFVVDGAFLNEFAMMRVSSIDMYNNDVGKRFMK
jgi:hypothetical protein